MRRVESGFTLIEMMIVVVIVSILMLVALPAYQDSVIRAKRSAARTALSEIMSRQEQFFINNKSYATTLAELGLPASYFVNENAETATSTADRVYQIALVLDSGVFDAATATPQNTQTKDTRCATYTLNVTGAKSNSGGGSVTECW
ncbi:type IV pilin protein [Parahaliea maris]|uniref:Type IV pilin protein n=1 Tax=Parahaliea maris TaxID=2716870 RepID=A0A5C8ZUD5_9GAMM|nr:type IV pilin protein [Parahaliea maris]TXS91419.1 type IV pilin protein [Parahaliea maris]